MSTRFVLGVGLGGGLALMIGMALAGGPGVPAPGSGAGRSDGPERVEVRGIENLYRLGPGLYSGGQPEGAEGFEVLGRLGVRTLVSVDGGPPDVETARRFGLRYVHLPVGYEGIPRAQAVRLAKVMKDLPGPVFVHCHHGKHRGPTAAALCGMVAEGWGREQARAWLARVGTDPAYKGLFATVDRFAPPAPEELARVAEGDLPERVEAPPLIEAMVAIDARWDRLKAAAKAGFRTPAGHPDADPPHEALLLAEQFREAARHGEAKARGEAFARMMAGAERDAAALEAALRTYAADPSPAARRGAEAAFAAAGRSCSACHARYRDDREVR